MPTSNDVERLFQEALGLDETAREAFLHALEPSVRREVEELLVHLVAAETGFLETPPADVAASLDAPEPEIVGRYRVIRKLGEGGMGLVYEAEQPEPLRRVALKIMKPLLPSSQLRRFQVESEILAQLRHPSIAHIYEAGVETVHYAGGLSTQQPFLAMELVDGLPLDDHARRSGLGLRERLELVARVADAVQSAHQHGVIHRDLKPANILVDSTGLPKVLDFGVARICRSEAVDETLRTNAGELIGTLPYMSPEQLRSEDVDTRSDVYALGVMLYELLTGRRPFEFPRGVITEVTARLADDRYPSPGQLDRRLRGDIEVIIATALERDPDRRYASAAALALDIRRFLAGHPIEARADSGFYVLRKQLRRHLGPVITGAAFVAALIAFAAIAFSLYRSAEEARAIADRQRAEATDRLFSSYVASARLGRSAPLPGRRTESLAALARAAEIRIEPVLRDEAVASLALSDLVVVREIEAPGQTLSSDGLAHVDRVAWTRNDTSVVTRLEDLVELARLPTTGPVLAHVFSPGGRYLLVREHTPEGQHGRVWDLTTSELLFDADPVTFYSARGTFHPREERVAFAARDSSVHLIPLDRAPSRRLPVGMPATHLAFDADGSRLALADGATLAIWDLIEDRRLGSWTLPTSLFQLAWTPDGTRIVLGGADRGVHVWDVAAAAISSTLRGHDAEVVDVAAPAPGRAVSQSWDGTTRLWDLTHEALIFDPLRNVGFCGAVGDLIALRQPGGAYRLSRLEPSPVITVVESDTAFVGPAQVAMDPGRSLLAVSSRTGVRLFDLETGVGRGKLPVAGTSDVIFEAPGRRLYTVSSGNVQGWEIERSGSIATVTRVVGFRIEHGNSVCTDPQENLIVACGRGGLVQVDRDTGEIERTWSTPFGTEHASCSADGRYLGMGTWQGPGGRVIDAATGDLVREFPGSSVGMGFSPDSRTLLVTERHQSRIVSTDTWEDRVVIEHPTDPFRAHWAFHPTKPVAALTASRYAIRLLDLETGETLTELENPDHRIITEVEFHPDGSRIFAITTGRTILVWNIERTRTELRALGLDWAD